MLSQVVGCLMGYPSEREVIQMEKIKEFIELCKATKKTRKVLAEHLLNCTFMNLEMDQASDLIEKMKEKANNSGVLSWEEATDGTTRLLIRHERYLEITSEENRIVTFHEVKERCEVTHYETVIEGFEIATVKHVWKETKNASA